MMTKSLVQQVHSCIVGEPECGHMQARAVIREVAQWIDAEARERGLQPHNGVYSAADWLRGQLEVA